jgi:2-polyprenyl-3-methyl-5-hydroxy-6-metoxy-1,4-benzoquinol methylase
MPAFEGGNSKAEARDGKRKKLSAVIPQELALASSLEDLLEGLDEELSDQDYLDRVARLSFAGVAWTPERISAVRDVLTPWCHNIKLAEGVYATYCEEFYSAHQEIMRVVNHALSGDFAGKRVLDVGCLEGYFSAECALQGAEVLGVEGKLINVKKCEFVKSVLGLQNLRFVQDDAMAVTREKYGSFEAVLVLGLIYHLDDPFTFLENVSRLCNGFALIDTLISFEHQPTTLCGDWKPELSSLQEFTYRDRTYAGRLYREFDTSATQVGKDLSTTASLRNEQSVWLTEEALVQLLRDVGFEQVEKLVYPRHEDVWWANVQRDARVLLLAVKKRSEFRSRIFTQT